MLTGHSPTSAENAVVVELKQWSDGTVGPSTADNCVELSIGKRFRRVLHPSVQVGGYQQWLLDNRGREAYCPDHRTGVKLPEGFAVTPLPHVDERARHRLRLPVRRIDGLGAEKALELHRYDVARTMTPEVTRVTDPIADLIGDYRAFTELQRDRLAARGIDIAPYELGHLAFRVPEWDQYVHLRTLLERHASANVEGVWNGRPMSMILLAEPLRVLDGQAIPLIELIPPVHQRVYKMGMEHFGVVVGEEVDAFSRLHREALTGQQFQNQWNEPYYILFEDFTHVKFHRRSLREVIELQGATFDGVHHVDDWVPQRLVTATGPNPLPG